jgi:CHAT domain-containing protein/Tfp pilus assembly protein PilF
MKRAMELTEKNQGANHPSVATYANNLAIFYISGKNFREAALLLEKALRIRLKSLGKDHPSTVSTYNALGGLCLEQKQYKEAETYFRNALSIEEKLYGPDYYELSGILGNLSLVLASENRITDAYRIVKRAMEIDNKTIEQVFSISSEQEKFSYLNLVNANYNDFLNLVTGYLAKDKEAVSEGMNAVLRRKGIVLDAMASERRMIALLNDKSARSVYNQLKEITSLIASLTLAGPGNLSPEAYSKKLAELENQRQQIEKNLAGLSGEYKAEISSRNADIKNIAAILPKGSVLVEFAVIRGRDLSLKNFISYNQYYAFVLESSKNDGGAKAPALINLGEAGLIDGVVGDFRKELEKTRWMLESGVMDEAAAEKRLAEKGKKVYDLVIAPIKAATGENKTLFLAPDGDLNLIPFGCIQDEAGKYLIETYNINYLSSGRDLIRFGQAAKNSGINIIAANPDYNLGKNSAKNDSIKNSDGGSGVSRTIDKCLFNWSPLSGTAAEADNIAKLLPKGETKEFIGGNALENSIKSIGAPNILHIATHGFFLEDQKTEDMDSYTSRGLSLSADEVNKNLQTSRIENPLLRCGLVFAGANTKGGNKAGQDDGILTAFEISGMNLEGTNLVVLSACDTGLGETKRGEGVFGLRRAFQLAGAKTIVMSLWSVPDQQTQELMTGFYESMQHGAGKSGALRESQLLMIKERREKTGAAHPYFWGAFISAGEP